MKLLVAAVLLSLADAASLQTFESTLAGIRASVISTRDAQRQAKSVSAAELYALSSEARGLGLAADGLRARTKDLRRRARDGEGASAAPALAALLAETRSARQAAEPLEAELSSIERSAWWPDPRLAAAAEDLAWSSQYLNSRANWLKGVAARAETDLARFSPADARALRGEAKAFAESASDLDYSAQRLRQRHRQGSER